MSNGHARGALHATICSLVVLLAALSLPVAASAAGGYNVVTINAECRGMAGNGWHTHEIKLKAKIVARGTTPANRLEARSVAQRQKADGSWLTVATWPDEIATYTADGTTHSLQAGRQFLMPTTDQKHGQKPHRIKLTLSAYDGTTLLFSDVLKRTCVN